MSSRNIATRLKILKTPVVAHIPSENCTIICFGEKLKSIQKINFFKVLQAIYLVDLKFGQNKIHFLIFHHFKTGTFACLFLDN